MRVLKATYLRSGGDLSIYKVARNRTAEVFASRVTARAPELRRPRFSFLYHQLVKEPSSGRSSSAGGEKSPHPILQLRITDQSDQLQTLKVRRFAYRPYVVSPSRRPQHLEHSPASVKTFFSRFRRLSLEPSAPLGAPRSVWALLYASIPECNVKKRESNEGLLSWGKALDKNASLELCLEVTQGPAACPQNRSRQDSPPHLRLNLGASVKRIGGNGG